MNLVSLYSKYFLFSINQVSSLIEIYNLSILKVQFLKKNGWILLNFILIIEYLPILKKIHLFC